MNPTLYYTVSRKELRPSEMPSTLPLLLSAASFASQRTDGSWHLVPPRTSLPNGPKGADCGGFVVTTKWNATYLFPPSGYVGWLFTWLPDWAATFDLCCFQIIRLKNTIRVIYPGASVVLARQHFATTMAENFWIRARCVPWAWCPSIQGFYPEEYEAHARRLAPLIRTMFAYYSDPGHSEEDEESAFRVGIGSLYGRTQIPVLLDIIERIQAIIGDDIPLHLWGVKLTTLKKAVALPGVVSVDTGAWNGLFGHEHEKRRASGLTEIEYSWRVSQPRYAQQVRHAVLRPHQMPLLVSPPAQRWVGVQQYPYQLADAAANDEEVEDDAFRTDEPAAP